MSKPRSGDRSEERSEVALLIAGLADRWTHELAAGVQPNVDEARRQHPQLRESIDQLYRCVVGMFDASVPSHELAQPAGKPTSATRAPEVELPLDSVPTRLGEFEIVEEIGRGGMGTVFRARQPSLNREVALKVLRVPKGSGEKLRRRFLREARAVAQLHHTNIVPIFDTGVAEGYHYFAMQLINGVGLDKFIRMLRREADEEHNGANPQATDPVADSITNCSLTGKSELTLSLDEGGDEGGAALEANRSDGIAFRQKSQLQGSYWQSIAGIGIQIAEALQHAHEHGVLHRDVKPSNLLIDGKGVVWVTDFGLAKADEEENLTRPGDTLGTLRYMAPEQLDGTCDSRSDVYAVGATLYELATRQPVHNATERRQLIKQVATEHPRPARNLEPRIPRDLAAIIDIALDPNPERRYSTAQELADDLKRFLEDRPISVRKTSKLNQLARWSRRHPSLALLSLLLLLLALGSPPLAFYYRDLVSQSQTARRESQLRLYEALQAGASAHRYSGRPGQRFDTLAALKSAAEVAATTAVPQPNRERMRRDAVAALTLPDLSVEQEWPVTKAGRLSMVHFGPDLEIYCTPEADGLNIRRFRDNQSLTVLPVESTAEKARFSPDGRLLSVTTLREGKAEVAVWDWRARKIVYQIAKPATMFASDFSPDGKWLAVGHEDSTVTVHELERKTQIRTLEVASPPITLMFHPHQPRLAVNCQTAYRTEIWDVDADQRLRSLPHPSDVFNAAWGPNGRYLAVTEGFDIHLWDLSLDRDEPIRILRGHTWVVSEVAFHPSMRLLYSHSWREGKTRVWDPLRGVEYFWSPGYFSTLGKAGDKLAYRKMGHVGVWRVATGAARVSLPFQPNWSPRTEYCDFSPDGTLLAGAGEDGIHLWELPSWQPLSPIRLSKVTAVVFEPDGKCLWAAHEQGLSRFRVERSPDRTRLALAEQVAMPEDLFPYHLEMDRSGQQIVADLVTNPDTSSTGTLLLIDRRAGTSRKLQGEPWLRYVNVAPNGDLAASGNWQGDGVTVWDLRSGEPLRNLDCPGSSVAAFSPDGKWVLTASISDFSLWEVGSWEKKYSVPRSAVTAALAISHDGKIFAATDSGVQVQLFELATGRPIVTLDCNDEPTYVRWLRFSPDDQHLAMCCAAEGLRVWDLSQVRDQLADLGLLHSVPAPLRDGQTAELNQADP